MLILDIKDEVKEDKLKCLKSITLEFHRRRLLYFTSDSKNDILGLYGNKLVDISPDLIVFKVLWYITCTKYHLHWLFQVQTFLNFRTIGFLFQKLTHRMNRDLVAGGREPSLL